MGVALSFPAATAGPAHDDASWTFPSPGGAIAAETAVRAEGHPDLALLDPADGWVHRRLVGGLVLALRCGRAVAAPAPLRLSPPLPPG